MQVEDCELYKKQMYDFCRQVSDQQAILMLVSEMYTFDNINENYGVFTSMEFDDFLEVVDFSFWNTLFERDMYNIINSNKDYMLEILDKFYEIHISGYYVEE